MRLTLKGRRCYYRSVARGPRNSRMRAHFNPGASSSRTPPARPRALLQDRSAICDPRGSPRPVTHPRHSRRRYEHPNDAAHNLSDIIDHIVVIRSLCRSAALGCAAKPKGRNYKGTHGRHGRHHARKSLRCKFRKRALIPDDDDYTGLSSTCKSRIQPPLHCLLGDPSRQDECWRWGRLGWRR